MRVKIGLETHLQLATKTKAFCSCRNPAALVKEPAPNTLTCPTCLGLPGSMPMTNERMLEAGVLVGIALNCKVAAQAEFSRKNYFYVDLARNYQLTQETPLGKKGFLDVSGKRVSIRSVHMEEDPAKLVHVGGLGGEVLADYNRSGIPLLEIVTEPCIASPKEARLYVQKLALILEYLGLYNPDSRAVIKSDANVSVNNGARVEVKNITGTKEVEKALGYEIARQTSVARKGRVEQVTRAWLPERGMTQQLRSKEAAEEYGYITEPDLARIEIPPELLKQLAKRLPELPDQKLERFRKQHRLSPATAEALISDPNLADAFETVAKGLGDPGLAGSWMAGYLKKTLNYHSITFQQSGVKATSLVYLLRLFKNRQITDRNAELTIRGMVAEKKPAVELVKKHCYKVQQFDIQFLLKDLLKNNPRAVKDFCHGETKALHFLVGQAVKATKGSVPAQDVRKALLVLLEKHR
ncbi:MAG: Asp-tRNA(Asn)/Glu-tRNA(Gln) amidotransferase subunit GatB [Candidatus Aenigmarchaeota archaeon]|nr:Asp-tRNA(Asn)/Glu-tRNA(Gln) amidotransferase subunit GatB [Candidatus Aenigmarchaeota archaeon]